MLLFCCIFFGVFGIWLAEKAITSKNESVIFYCGIAAMVSLSGAALCIAYYLS